MPVTPKHDWEETESTVRVRVQIVGLSRTKPNVFATSALLKINAPPYLFLLDLHKDVDPSKSSATVDREGVTFKLVKKDTGLWGKLHADGNKNDILKRRNDSIETAHQQIEEARTKRLERKQQEAKIATDRQIELDRRKRQLIEERKKNELEQERTKLKEWESRISSGGKLGTIREENESEEDEEEPAPDHPHYHGRGWQAELKEEDVGKIVEIDEEDDCETSTTGPEDEERGNGIWCSSELGNTATAETEFEENSLPADKDDRSFTFTPLPPSREPLEVVSVQFTQLETPHLPAREQREEEIRLYKKQIRDEEAQGDGENIGERQPAFLKDKGDALYKQGNYRGAINAYSRAIDLDANQAPCYSNRAACHLKLGEPRSCIADCSTAMRLLEPKRKRYQSEELEDAENFKRTLCRLHSRRASAHCEVDEVTEAIADFEEALRYDPQNMEVKENLEEAKAYLRPADITTLLDRGAARFRVNDHMGAKEAYTLALRMPCMDSQQKRVALTNRAASNLVLEEYEMAVLDCGSAIELLMGDLGVKLGAVHSWVQDIAVSNAGGSLSGWEKASFKRGALCRLLCRRAAALSHLRGYQMAMQDYNSAIALFRNDGQEEKAQSLENDIAKVRSLLESAVA